MGRLAPSQEHLSPSVGARLTDFKSKGTSGLDALGKFVPMHRRSAAMELCRNQIGMSDSDKIMRLIDGMVIAIERDHPYDALDHAMRFVDLTGAYMIYAVLLTAEKPVVRVPAGRA